MASDYPGWGGYPPSTILPEPAQLWGVACTGCGLLPCGCGDDTRLRELLVEGREMSLRYLPERRAGGRYAATTGEWVCFATGPHEALAGLVAMLDARAADDVGVEG